MLLSHSTRLCCPSSSTPLLLPHIHNKTASYTTSNNWHCFKSHCLQGHRSSASKSQTVRLRQGACRSTTSLLEGSAATTRPGEFRWGSFLSRKEFIDDAVAEAVSSILLNIGKDAQPNIALVFVSSAYGQQYDRVVPALRELVPSLQCIYGCSVSTHGRECTTGDGRITMFNRWSSRRLLAAGLLVPACCCWQCLS
jgi:hypothetical protein